MWETKICPLCGGHLIIVKTLWCGTLMEKLKCTECKTIF